MPVSYDPPPNSSYLLGEGFSMPSSSGDRWAISFSNKGASLLVTSLSVLVTISFVCFWNLIIFAGMFIGMFRGTLPDGSHSRRRYVALVTLWNSPNPWFAFRNLLDYLMQNHRGRKLRADLLFGVTLCTIALFVFSGGLAMGVFAPALVQIGNVAPVRPNALFYPEIPSADSPGDMLKEFGLRAPSVMRALGSVETTQATSRSKVLIIEGTDHEPWNGSSLVRSVDYSYHLSGVDMGLRGGSELALHVQGYCITEYEWTVEVNASLVDPDSGDAYLLWNDPSKKFWVPLNKYDIDRAPTAKFEFHPDILDQFMKDSNVSYAVAVSSAHHSSISHSDDPWYATEERPPPSDDLFPPNYNATFWMKRYRPVLSCWEKAQWSWGGQNVSNIYELRGLPGMKIKDVLLDVLEATLNGPPMITRVGNASGDTALRSRTTSPNGVIDAAASKMFTDMERLVTASYVATKNIFVDSTMFGNPKEKGYPNVFWGSDNEPRDGSGEFVVSSPDILTFSLTGIVILVVILATPILLNGVAWAALQFSHKGSSNNNNGDSSGTASDNEGSSKRTRADIWTQFHVLSAVQLFRCLYENGQDTRTYDWSCQKMIPESDDPRTFKLVRGCTEPKCMGHIMRDVGEKRVGERRVGGRVSEEVALLDKKGDPASSPRKIAHQEITPVSPSTP